MIAPKIVFIAVAAFFVGSLALFFFNSQGSGDFQEEPSIYVEIIINGQRHSLEAFEDYEIDLKSSNRIKFPKMRTYPTVSLSPEPGSVIQIWSPNYPHLGRISVCSTCKEPALPQGFFNDFTITPASGAKKAIIALAM